MGWQDLLTNEETRVLPWTGGRQVSFRNRTWRVKGKLPLELGWYEVQVDGSRDVRFGTEAPANQDFEQGHKLLRGYIVGERFISDSARVDPDPTKLIEQTQPVFLVEPGLERFARALCVITHNQDGPCLVYLRQEFPQGQETEVEEAYQDRKPDVGHLPGVTPALDLAFRWLTFQRAQDEVREREEAARRAAEERRLEAEERHRQALRDIGTGAGRRALAARDFAAAARAALAISGAELLDNRPGRNRGEMVVQYRFRHRRLECVVNAETLRVMDAGVCLDNHAGTKGDTLFTLESLPVVIAQAMREGRLVVWRRAPGDQEQGADHRRDFDDDEDDD